jgi:hypothetical protein
LRFGFCVDDPSGVPQAGQLPGPVRSSGLNILPQFGQVSDKVLAPESVPAQLSQESEIVRRDHYW